MFLDNCIGARCGRIVQLEPLPGNTTASFTNFPSWAGSIVNLPPDQIVIAATSDLAGVQSFYMQVGYGVGLHPGDRLLIAKAAQSIVAAVRLCTEGGTLVLRGMYVAGERRGQGIGTRLLQSLPAEIGSSECWCIPYTHLTGFYSRIGFHLCEGDSIPPFLADRRTKYLASGKDVVVMKRSGRGAKGKGP